MSRLLPFLRAVPKPKAPEPLTEPVLGYVPHGGATLENHDRTVYQSARTRIGGTVPPLPLTEAQAWAEAEAILKEQRCNV